MDDLVENDILLCFRHVPHRGISRMANTLQAIGVSINRRKWAYIPSDHYPRVEMSGRSGTKFSLGVSRQPLVGYISWASVQRVDEANESSAILRTAYRETDRIWSIEYVPRIVADPAFDQAVAELFPAGIRELRFDKEDLVNAHMQRFVDLFDSE
ncbi:hypothetical protein IT407_04865 [Candidatus Uhrbacteria bacterium]|nr:hypothetical protein [Candidatus Uhrbacteria bacterium]